MRFVGFFLVVLLLHGVSNGMLANALKNRPLINRLGYVPEPAFLRLASFDQKSLVAFSLITKVTMYFSSRTKNDTDNSVQFDEIYTMLKTATRLDPYNMDAYYFAQAVMTWDAREVEKANELMAYGMRYRTWDWYLPLFLGFNYGYFLKDFPKAAHYYRLAGQLNGSPLYKRLAGRYLYESGQTELAIAYLEEMLKSTRNQEVRQAYRQRIVAFTAVRDIEQALAEYQRQFHQLPQNIKQLIEADLLPGLPIDPYGGEFYITSQGQVRSTSNFAVGFLIKKSRGQDDRSRN